MGIDVKTGIHRFIVKPLTEEEPRSTGFLGDAHALGIYGVTNILSFDLFFIEGAFTEKEIRQVSDLLYDPVTQKIEHSTFGDASGGGAQPTGDTQIIDVALRPGVTDPVAEQVLRAARMTGVRGIRAAATGQRFLVSGTQLNETAYQTLAARLFSNPVVQHYTLGEMVYTFPEPTAANGTVELLLLREMQPEELTALSADRRAALDLNEMLAIQAYCRQEKRDLTDIEFEMIAQTWSEHCVHKTFKAQIDVRQEGEPAHIENLFNETIRAATRSVAAPWVRSAFVDNAGVIDFDEQFELSFKVETHNHPSAIEPFGGANTGIGGVIRDVVGVSAKPIASTDVLCFGPQDTHFLELPEGVLHPKRIFSGVVAGIQDYGNKIGIPTVSGGVWYDPGYIANPLVYCGCLGIAPKGLHPRKPLPGDHIIVLGGRTGRDGLRGATFSSMAMDAQTGEVAGASVQIGAPVVEKGLIDVIMLARDRRLYHAITDCGAGGLSSAVGEMSSELGALVQLDAIPLKYAGLAPWEVWLSEAQERMVLAVPSGALTGLQTLCTCYDVEMTDIGRFTDSGRLEVRNGDAVVLNLDNHFLHNGLPQRRLSACIHPPEISSGVQGEITPNQSSFGELLLRLLAHPNIASKSEVIRLYDHEVQGGSVIKPLVGELHEGPSDAVVIRPLMTHGEHCAVLSAGFNPEYGKLDAYQMALNVIDEAVRNALAVGADPERIALLDNFCWGDPRREETLGQLVEAARGCHDGAVYFGAPFISGKDSFNNEYLGADGQRHAIPPSLLISAVTVMESWKYAVSMDLKRPGSLIYLVGEMQPVFGGSHYNLVCEKKERQTQDGIPSLHPATRYNYACLHEAIKEKLVLTCHDLSEGGLAVAAAEMCIGGRLGLFLDLGKRQALRWLFGETTGCLLVEVAEEDRLNFEENMIGASTHLLGRVTAARKLVIRKGDRTLLAQSLSELCKAWKTPPHAIG